MGCCESRDGAGKGVKLQPRQWLSLDSAASTQDVESTTRVRVLTWNVLAQQLTHNIVDGNRVSSFEKVPDEYLEWEHRKPLFEQEFFKRDQKTDELFWDVICMQEFTCHKELFEGRGEADRYESHIMQRKHWTNAIYFNPAKFAVLGKEDVKYVDPETQAQQTQGFISVLLQCRKTLQKFYVYTTHLKAKKGFEIVRENQAKQLVEHAQAQSHPVILCGDWNDVPDSLALSVVRGTEGIRSAAGEAGEPDYTTHKYRPTTGM